MGISIEKWKGDASAMRQSAKCCQVATLFKALVLFYQLEKD